jgi:hypothetical protein
MEKKAHPSSLEKPPGVLVLKCAALSGYLNSANSVDSIRADVSVACAARLLNQTAALQSPAASPL